MSRTTSEMIELGTQAPPFALEDVLSGRVLSRDDVFDPSRHTMVPGAAPGVLAGSGGHRRFGLLVMFVCVHCPYVKHVEGELARLGHDYSGPDGPMAFVAVQSNDTLEYPQDNADGMREQAQRLGWNFPYLLDDVQEVARSYGAACTPDFFLFDAGLKLAYRGQLDGSRPRRGDFGNDNPVSGADLRAAMDALIAGKLPDPNQSASIGCNIKWKQS